MVFPVIPTNKNGTMYIAVLFVFVAYFLHPKVERALHQLKAYRAWRAINERSESVEVTQLSTTQEILRGRGKWDAARIIAVLLVVFSLASWGLELRLELVKVTAGPVDMMDRPPPVVYWGEEDVGWEVRSDFDASDNKGFLGNFQNTLEAGSATTRYARISDNRVRRQSRLYYQSSTSGSNPETPPAVRMDIRAYFREL